LKLITLVKLRKLTYTYLIENPFISDKLCTVFLLFYKFGTQSRCFPLFNRVFNVHHGFCVASRSQLSTLASRYDDTSPTTPTHWTTTESSWGVLWGRHGRKEEPV